MKKIKRVVSLILVLTLLLMTCVNGLVFAAEKEQINRVIGIVFDNSGSMYDSDAWCRATYATEVFAAMLNDGDILQVYPMNEMDVNGKIYTEDSPLTINGPSEAGAIRQMHTSITGGYTPIETIDCAYKGIQKLEADEKWLILLTDGTVFYNKVDGSYQQMDEKATQKALAKVLGKYAKKLNVLYLGIGSDLLVPKVKGSEYLYQADVASESNEVLSKLTEMSNTIFGRDVLPISGENLEFDVSMGKLIVFVQGDNISDVSLENTSGSDNGVLARTYGTRYSEKGAGPSVGPIDTSLQGSIATYTDLDAGTYHLSYNGDMTSIAVYYEPDVDLSVTLIDKDENAVDLNSEVYSGDYKLNYCMVDKYGVPNSSKLLGNIGYNITYTLNDIEHSIVDDKAGSVDVSLSPGDTINVDANVTYLSGYKAHKSGVALGWPESGILTATRQIGSLEASFGYYGEDKLEYKLSTFEEEAKIHVSMFRNGEVMSSEELAATEAAVIVTGGNAEYELTKAEDGYDINLKYAEGDAEKTECGDYELQFAYTFTNEDGITSDENVLNYEFSLVDDRRDLALTLDAPQTYYVISQKSEWEPMFAQITRNGELLSAEDLDSVEFNVDTDLSLDIEKDYGNSGYTIKMRDDENVKTGKHDIKISASVTDELGKNLNAEAEADVELEKYPKWVKFAVLGIILIILAILLFLFFNMKVLPKKIMAQKCTFTVDGEPVPGAPSVKPQKQGKKTGTIEVQSPKYAQNSAVKWRCSLSLKAVSPRRVKSANREAEIKALPVVSSSVQSFTIGTKNFVRDEETNKIVLSGGKAFAPFTIRNNAVVKGTAVINDGSSDIEVFFSTNLKFK